MYKEFSKNNELIHQNHYIKRDHWNSAVHGTALVISPNVISRPRSEAGIQMKPLVITFMCV